MRNGETVAAFERELAAYCGAKYAIAAANGTVTLQAALVALGVKPGDRVATTPLTMSATSIAILNVGAVPVFEDVYPQTWLNPSRPGQRAIGVSLYGLHYPNDGAVWIDDAAQTLRQHHKHTCFTSLSFQASKILSTGEGGALLTNVESLAEAARSYLSLGYAMRADQARIDPAVLKRPDYARHVQYPAVNGRMNDATAAEGLRQLGLPVNAYVCNADLLLYNRAQCADMYRDAIAGCAWLTPQAVPSGMSHDYWAYAVACDTPERAIWLQDTMARLGAEVPYGAWRLTYQEPAFADLPFALGDHVKVRDGHAVFTGCPVAESLQPRILAFQCNNLASAEQNARALHRSIEEAA